MSLDAAEAWRSFPWSTVHWRAELRTGTIAGVDLPGPAGPPIVLVHGLGGQWQHWLPILIGLARHRRVVAVDLPGCGGSDPLTVPPAVDHYAQCVIDAAAARGVERAVLVGHSFGGCVVTAIAANQPELAAHLAVASVPALPRGAVSALAPSLLGGLAIAAARLGSAYAPFVSRARVRRAILRQAVADPRSIPADAAHLGYLSAPMGSLAQIPRAALAFAGEEFARCASAIRCPATVVWGEQDRIVPIADAAVVARLLRASRVVAIPRAGHLVMLERPERFLDALSPAYAAA